MTNIKQDFWIGDFYPKDLTLKQKNAKYYLSLLFAFLLNLILFAFLMSFNLFAQNSGGGYSAAYTFRDIGARATGMGGAFTAVSDDATTLFYNPAGLTNLSENANIVTSVTNAGFNRIFSNFAYGQSVNENIGIGIGLNSFNSGGFTARDARGREIGKFNDWQYNLAMGVAYKKESMSIGVATKFFKQNLQSSGLYADGFGIDIGTKFNVLEMFTFGAAVQNLGGTMIWNTDKYNIDKIPYSIRTGVAWQYGLDDEKINAKMKDNEEESEEIYLPASKYIIFSVDGVINQYEKSPTFVFGAEAIVHEYLGFRGGIAIYSEDNHVSKLLPMNKWSLGVSIRPHIEELPFKTTIDYSAAKEFLIENQINHNVTIYFNF